MGTLVGTTVVGTDQCIFGLNHFPIQILYFQGKQKMY